MTLLRGTRIIEGQDAELFSDTIDKLKSIVKALGFQEVIIPSIWSQDTFIKKAGENILNEMYAFNDKKGRDICLVPEITAIIEEMWKTKWSKEKKKPHKIFYISRCYRYERPQEGRYREFFQFGVEILGGKPEETDKLCQEVLTKILDSFEINYTISKSVKRGLDYYVEDGFEVECEKLGAQKQIMGGGRYESGIGFAFGVDRLILAMKKLDNNPES